MGSISLASGTVFALAAALAIGAPGAQARAPVSTDRHAGDAALRRLVATQACVLFERDSYDLSPGAMRTLDRFARRFAPAARAVRIEAVGYADSTGTGPHNLLLAERRATAVLHYLHQRGVSLLRMSSVSYGPAARGASNATAEGRAANRRVVIVVLPWKPGQRQA